MRLGAIFRFDLALQLRRPRTWLFFIVLAAFAFLNTGDESVADALYEDYFLNSPFAIATTTVIGTMLWLMAAAVVGGVAAARDVETGMHPLVWTTPVSRTEYLGGRFLSALLVNATLLLAVQAGILLAIYRPGVNPDVIGPFRAAAFVNAYAIISLPNAFFGTAIQFWLAARSGRAMSGYLGSFCLFFMGFFVAALLLYYRGLGTLLDPIGMRYIIEDLAHQWTPTERYVRLLALEGGVLWNRLLWLGIGAAALALTWARFRFEHRTATTPLWRRVLRRRAAPAVEAPAAANASPVAPVPPAARTFGFAGHARVMLATARTSFGAIVRSRPGLTLLIGLPLLAIVVVLFEVAPAGIPLTPVTGIVIQALTAPLTEELSRWIIVPLLLIHFAGELVWRERDAHLGDITDALPTSGWPLLLGRFLGLGLLLVLFMTLLSAAGITAQAFLGHRDFELGLYVTALLGLQLPDYLLFAVLALVVHTVLDNRYVAHMAMMVIYAFIAMPALFHVEQDLLVYGAGPWWSYSDMRGFGASLEPWARYRLYWGAWAVLLAVAARLLWVRGRERSVPSRMRAARRRLTRATVASAAAGAALVVTLGGFIIHDTRRSFTASEVTALQAEYEKLYGSYEGVPQPRIAHTRLHVEIRPDQRVVDIRGTYHLVNRSAAAIDTVHVAIIPGARNGPNTLDRPAQTVLEDDVRGHRIYALATSLEPGDSLALGFDVRVDRYQNRGPAASVVANGTFFTNEHWLPAIGYQPRRELMSAGDRRRHGLAPQPLIPPLHDVDARMIASERTTLDVVIGTADGQVAVAPGALRRTWTENGRRYFHYATDGAIGNDYAFFSAAYSVREATWNHVTIRILHHPSHTANLERMMRSVAASLDEYTRAFGPYPYSHLTLAEVRGMEIGMSASPALIRFSEGTALWDVPDDAQALDLPFDVVAHEVAHQWWGHQLEPAYAEGAPVIGEGLAVYSAMMVVESAFGHDRLRRYLAWMRRPEPYAPIHRGEPLLRGLDPYQAYRRAPFALYALRGHVGADSVRLALRRFFGKHPAGVTPLATTLDLYRELQAVTPDSARPLLRELFEQNTFWQLTAERATAVQAGDSTWQVTLELRARKLVTDTAGAETDLPLDDWIEVGVFGGSGRGRGRLDAPLYLGRHRIRTGRQSITVSVTGRPALAGIDPHHVLDWEEREDDDNITRVKVDG